MSVYGGPSDPAGDEAMTAGAALRGAGLRAILRCAAVCLAAAGGAALAADAGHGKALFAACAACHSEAPDAIGPNLKGVFGRRSAALEDYRYSGPMKRANLVWDAANLRDYLIDPQAKVRGNRMPFGGVASQAEADDLVAFLETYR